MTNSPARILYLDHAPIFGGAEVVLLNLVQALDRASFTPIVATSGDSPLMPELGSAGVAFATVPFGRLNKAGAAMPFNLIRAAQAVVQVVRRSDIALIHTNTIRTHIVGSIAAMITKTPVIWTLHDNTFPPTLVRLLAPIPVRVIAVSNWLRNLYAPAGLGQKTIVIPNGINLKVPSVPAADIRKELHLPADAPLVINVGRLVAGKAPHLFIEAARIISRTIPNAYFILVGGADRVELGQLPSPYRDHLVHAARESGLGERLLMVGHRSDAVRFYAAADLVVYCAVLPEGLPTVLLEAMLHAKPIVASDIGGAREIVRSGTNGLLVPPKNAATLASSIIQLLEDKPRARQMGIAGRAILETEFDMQTQVTRIEQVYTRCLKSYDANRD